MYLKKLLMAAVTAVIVGIGIASPSAVMAAPQVMADGGIFDAEYYAAANPDVAAIFGTDANSLYIHYVNFGVKEGRLPYAAGAAVVPQAAAVNAPAAVSTTESFDAAYYAMANPDVVSVLGTDPGVLYNHYISYGKKEGRRASAGTAAVSVQKAATVQQTAVQPAAQQQVAQPVVTQSASGTYVLNTNTHKFHYPYCSSVNEMNEKNKQNYIGSRDDIIGMGYSPCGRCHP